MAATLRATLGLAALLAGCSGRSEPAPAPKLAPPTVLTVAAASDLQNAAFPR